MSEPVDPAPSRTISLGALRARARRLAERQGPSGLLGILAVVLFAIIGIGGPLVGVGVFSSSGDLEGQPPWRDQRETLPDETPAPVSDTWDGYGPALAETASRLRQGDLPLTSPFEAGGHPFGAATPVSGAWNPINLPWLLLPERLAHGYAKLVEIAIAAGFTYLFCRRVRLGPGPSWLAAGVYVGSGFIVAWTGWPHAHAAALVPAVFWAGERLVQERRLAAAVPLALLGAWQLAAGFPLVSVYTVLALTVYLAMRLVSIAREEGWRPVVPTLGHLAASGAIAALVAAPIVVGLGTTLEGSDLTYRDEFRGAVLNDLRGLLTAVFTYPLGVPTWGTWSIKDFIVESHLFVGAGAVLLVAAGLLCRPPEGLPRGVRPFMLGLPLLAVALIYRDTPLLTAVQAFPGLGTSFIARIRVLFGFGAAVSVGIAAASWSEARRWSPTRERVVAVVLGLVALVAAVAAARALWPVRPWHRRSHLLAGTTLILGAAVAGVFLWVARARRAATWARWGVGVVALAAVAESLVLVLPYWGRTPVDEHYRVTPEIALMQELQGDDRVEFAGALWPGVNAVYELRTTTGHTFFPDRWRDLVLLADPEAFPGRTFARLGPTADLASPALDRMAVTHVLVGTNGTVPGEVSAVVADAPPLLPDGDWVSVTIPATPLRSVGLVLGGRLNVVGRSPRLEVEIREAGGGRVLFAGGRSLPGSLRAWVELAVDPEPAASSQLEVRVRLVGTGVPADLGPQPLLRLVADPGDDGLRTVAALPGGLVLERTRALDRYRWASSPVLVVDDDDRRVLLAEGLRPDEVVVEQAVELPGEPGAAQVVAIDESDPDRRRIEVVAQGAGVLVIADAHLSGWRVRVDGEAAELLTVDHALMGVVLPAGSHTVELVYHARVLGALWWTGLGVLVAVTVLLAGEGRLRRLRGRARP